MARIHYVIPDDLHRSAKAHAALRGETLREYIVNALTAATANDEKPADPPVVSV